MCAKWNKNYDPDLLVTKLEESRTDEGQDGVAFAAREYHEYITVLHSSIEFAVALPEKEERAILSRAVFRSAAKGVLSQHSILAEISREEHAYLRGASLACGREKRRKRLPP
jgi:hypothetical protein